MHHEPQYDVYDEDQRIVRLAFNQLIRNDSEYYRNKEERYTDAIASESCTVKFVVYLVAVLRKYFASVA